MFQTMDETKQTQSKILSDLQTDLQKHVDLVKKFKTGVLSPRSQLFLLISWESTIKSLRVHTLHTLELDVN